MRYRTERSIAGSGITTLGRVVPPAVVAQCANRVPVTAAERVEQKMIGVERHTAQGCEHGAPRRLRVECQSDCSCCQKVFAKTHDL